MDRRELDRAVALRDACRVLLPHRGGRAGLAAAALGGALLLSMILRIIAAEPPVPTSSPRAASVAQRHAPVLPTAPAVEAGRSDWAGGSR